MKSLWISPVRNLVGGLAFVATVMVCAIFGYMANGWSFGDALYMAVLTIYTVGYDEVRPIDTPALRAVTLGLIVFGCTGMIFLTGVLVQFITFSQLQQLLGTRRMQNQIERLCDHVIICGFGRIGGMVAKELHAGLARFVVLERLPERVEEARALGYLALQADATDETVLEQVGVKGARVLATVLPNDAANVFITLSARSLNADLVILARGEAPSTVKKLVQAGANTVVQPAHIGAERFAELILYPAAASSGRGNAPLRAVEPQLRRAGLGLELAVVEAGSAFAGLTVGEIQRAAGGAFLVVGVERPGAAGTEAALDSTRVQPGDGVLVMGRMGLTEALRGFRTTAA